MYVYDIYTYKNIEYSSKHSTSRDALFKLDSKKNIRRRLYLFRIWVFVQHRSSKLPNYDPESHRATHPLIQKATQPASQTDRQPGHPARHGFRGSGPGANMAPEYVKNVGQNHLDIPPPNPTKVQHTLKKPV